MPQRSIRAAAQYRPAPRPASRRPVRDQTRHSARRARRDGLRVDVVGTEQRRRSQVGVHGALRVGADEDEAAARRRTGARPGRLVADPGGDHVVGEHRSELVITDPAEVLRRPTEGRNACHGVRSGPTGHLDTGAHALVEEVHSVGLDQVHRAFDQFELTGVRALIGKVNGHRTAQNFQQFGINGSRHFAHSDFLDFVSHYVSQYKRWAVDRQCGLSGSIIEVGKPSQLEDKS